MPIKVETNKVAHLLKQVTKLSDIPRKFPIEGFLRNITRNILPYSVYVDKWPDFEVIIAKPEDEEVQKLPLYRLGLYSKNPGKLANVLCQPGFLPSTKPIRIFGLPVDLIPDVQTASKYLYLDLKLIGKDDPRYMMAIDRVPTVYESLERSFEKEFYLSELNPEKEHVKIASHWRYWKEHHDTLKECEDAIQYYMRTGPSVGVYTRGNHELVSWMLSNVDTTNMFGHTLPEYRRRGLQSWIASVMVKQKLEMGDKIVLTGYFAKSTNATGNGMKKLEMNIYDQSLFVECVLRSK